MKTHQDFLEIACDAAQIGAKTLKTSHPDTVQHKGDRDLVTDIDLAIQRDIDDYLGKPHPTFPCLPKNPWTYPISTPRSGFGFSTPSTERPTSSMGYPCARYRWP